MDKAVFSEEFQAEIAEAIKAQPKGARDHLAFNSLVENRARAEFRDLWQANRPPAAVQDVDDGQEPPPKKSSRKKTSRRSGK